MIRGFLSTANVDRALALCHMGQHTKAIRVSDQPRAPYDAEWVIKWHRVRALAFHAAGSQNDALQHAGIAVAAAKATEYLEFQAEALTDRATILDGLGRTADARADLQAALALYDSKGHRIGQERIRGRLVSRA